MKSFKDFKPNCRCVASNLWGPVNNAIRTTRTGFYYYDCAGHGGYVVDSKYLTKEELDEIGKYIEPSYINVFVIYRSETPDNKYYLGVSYYDFGGRNRQFCYSFLYESMWIEYPIYVFEEDCNWVIVEKITGVRLKNNMSKEMDEIVENEFNRNFVNK